MAARAAPVAAARRALAPSRATKQALQVDRPRQRAIRAPVPPAAPTRASSPEEDDRLSPALFPRMPSPFRLTKHHVHHLRLSQTYWESLGELETALGVSFQSRTLLAHALMHSSFVNNVLSSREAGTEHGDTARSGLLSNRWLAMLGDSVLNMVVTTTVAQSPSGQVSWEYFTPKSHIMRSNQLFSQVASDLTVPKYLRIAPGVTDVSPTMAATALEAIVGAVYIDQGLVASIRFVERVIMPRLQQYRPPADEAPRIRRPSA